MTIPLCPHCNIPMEIHETNKGDQYLCDNYWKCGGRMSIKETREL